MIRMFHIVKSFSLSTLYILLLNFCFSPTASAQTNGIQFGNDFEEALEMAKAQDKNVFVDVYADWCMPCKMMDRNVFTDKEVAEFMNERFVSVKIDAERRGRKFARKNKVYAFPTLLFFNSSGEEMHRVLGFANENRLMRSADMSFRNPSKQLKAFKEDYKRKKNDPIFLEDYIAFAEQIEDYELADKIAEQYAKNYRKARKVDWMDFVLKYVYKEKSKLFTLLKEYKEDFNQLYGEETVNNVFMEIIINSAIGDKEEPETQDVIQDSRKKINKYGIKVSDDQLLPSIAARVFNIEIPFKNDDARTDLAARVLNDYSGKMDDKTIKTMLATLAVNRSDQPTMKIANQQIDKLIGKSPSLSLHDLKSIFLYKLGDKEESYKQVALAQEFATRAGVPYKSTLREMKIAGLIE